MKHIVKKLRSNFIINKVIRNLLIGSSGLLKRLSDKWSLSGTVTVSFSNKKLKFFTREDDGIVDALFYGKNYVETGDIVLFSELSRQSSVIVDIGANTGIYSVIGAVFNPSAKVIAFEPHPVNQARFQKNIELNHASNVQLIKSAAGDTKERVLFTVPEKDIISDTSSVNKEFSQSFYKGELKWKQITVPQMPLDIFFAETSQVVDLIKIDVEGYEMNVFEGAQNFFRNNSPVIFCEIFLSDKSKKYFDAFLEEYQYTPYIIFKEGILRLDDGLTKNYVGYNFLFAKGKTKEVFTSFKVMDKLISEIKTPVKDLPQINNLRARVISGVESENRVG